MPTPDRPKFDRRRYYMERRHAVASYIREAKSRPCMDCGGTFPPECMDFDHVRGEKEQTVARTKAKGWALERVKLEIAKCDLVCANCHRIRHAYGRRYWDAVA